MDAPLASFPNDDTVLTDKTGNANRRPVPKVSVVIPVYNASKYLVPAIASVIEQSFCDWEMVCVNDGSTDDSLAILQWFASVEPRIRVLHQGNSGIVGALNAGIEASQADYIVRMDADDICMPDRIEAQVLYMDQSPDCVALGCWIMGIDQGNRLLGIQQLPTDHTELVARLLRRETAMFHPTTLFRKNAWTQAGKYRKDFQWIEDHDLWLRMSELGKITNLPQIGLFYRLHAASVCWQKAQKQRELMNALLMRAHQDRGAKYVPDTSEPKKRSQAGPGKWARMAMRGGYPTSAAFHWKELLKNEGVSRYSARMSFELLMRLPSCLLHAWNNNQFNVPSYEHWISRMPLEFQRRSPLQRTSA